MRGRPKIDKDGHGDTIRFIFDSSPTHYGYTLRFQLIHLAVVRLASALYLQRCFVQQRQPAALTSCVAENETKNNEGLRAGTAARGPVRYRKP